MYQRDKNMPCIVLWSLGNEAGYGPAHLAMAGYIRACDDTRPVRRNSFHFYMLRNKFDMHYDTTVSDFTFCRFIMKVEEAGHLLQM
jgi:beta-galactosidase/beta-glucuronidase